MSGDGTRKTMRLVSGVVQYRRVGVRLNGSANWQGPAPRARQSVVHLAESQPGLLNLADFFKGSSQWRSFGRWR